MRIAVYHDMPSGGGKRALFEIVRGMGERHTVDAYTLFTYGESFCDIRPCCNSFYKKEHRRIEIRTKPFAYLNPLLENAGFAKLKIIEKRIAQIIDSKDYDAVFVSHGVYCKSPFVLRYLRTPSLYYCQEPWRQFHGEERKTNGSFKELFFDVMYAPFMKQLKESDIANARSATRTLVNSKYSKAAVKKAYGIDAEVCRLGVDIGKFRQLDIAKENMVISIGRLHESKGYDFLIASLARVQEECRPRLCIVADQAPDDEKARLMKLAESGGVGLEIHCAVEDRELVELINRSMFAVYSPTGEPLGFLPLEAGACGIPAIGVAEGGVLETIRHGETGILCERDEERFADAVAQLAGDAEARERLGGAARRMVAEEWTWRGTVREIERHLEELSENV